MQCPECKSTHIRKNGNRRGKQNHICVDCGRQFVDHYTSGLSGTTTNLPE
jgi:transposase-like protein